MRFTKMQGIGNDYVYINCFDEAVPDPSSLARKVSDRHFGVGSDGLVLIGPSNVADFKMSMYNADGSQAEMCGNAIRCVGKYVYDRKITDQTRLSVETLAGIKYLELNVQNGAVDTVRVNMGGPIFDPKRIPILSDKPVFRDEEMEVAGKRYRVTGVSVGNPHAVTYVDDVAAVDIETVGPLLEHHALFPKRINTEFVQVIDPRTLRVRVWERGAGETLACGTGACAAMVASVWLGKIEDRADVILPGGTLFIEWDRARDTVYMTGPAAFVFEGVLL